MIAFVPIIKHWRFYLDGTESGSTPIAAEDTNIERNADTDPAQFHLRWLVQETGGVSGATTDDYQLQEFVSSVGSWNNVDASSSFVQSDPVSTLSDGAATTNRATNGLTDPGTGSFVAGEQEDVNGLIEDRQLTVANFTEHVYGLKFPAPGVFSDGDTIDFRLLVNGAIVGTTPANPRITVRRAGPTAVGKSLALNYDIRQAVGKSVALPYHIKEAVGESLSLNYHIREAIGESLLLAYDIRSPIGESLALNYDVREAVGESLSLAYDIRQAVGESLVIAYDILGDLVAVGKSLVLAYDIREAVGESLALNYDLREAVGVSLVVPYHIRETVGASLVLPYHLRASVGKSIELAYAIRALAGKSMVLPYDVLEAVGKSLVLLYDIEGEVERTVVIPTWTIIANPARVLPVKEGEVFDWLKQPVLGGHELVLSVYGVDDDERYLYVTAGGANQRFLVYTQTAPIVRHGGDILWLSIATRVRRLPAGQAEPVSFRPVLRVDGVDASGPQVDLDAADLGWRDYGGVALPSWRWWTNPQTGAPWTLAQALACQIGLENLTGASPGPDHELRCTSIEKLIFMDAVSQQVGARGGP